MPTSTSNVFGRVNRRRPCRICGKPDWCSYVRDGEHIIKTLKYEEGYLNVYETQSEARASISKFIERIYNQKRLHSALGYLPPAEFEKALALKTIS